MLVAQLCLFVTPMNHSSSGSSVHGILQTRILERVAIPISRGSSQPRDRPESPELQAYSLPREAVKNYYISLLDCALSLTCCVIHDKSINISETPFLH